MTRTVWSRYRALYVTITLAATTTIGAAEGPSVVDKARSSSESLRDTAELKALEERMSTADSNAGMKAAASALGSYWDKRLERVEKRIERLLDRDGIARFRTAQKTWRDYRSAEVVYKSDYYRGGSMASLIGNQKYAELTEDRVRDLEEDSKG